MRGIVFILFFMALFPETGLSQTSVVRGGEHAGFTRLVFSGDFSDGWKLERLPEGYQFKSSNHQIDWNLAQAFDRIGRERIKYLKDIGEGKLLIAVSKASYAEAFMLNDGKIVIDIKDGKENTLNDAEDPNLPFGPMDLPEERRPPELARLGLPLTLGKAPEMQFDPSGNSTKGGAASANGAQTAAATITSPTVEQRSFAETQSLLLDELARAAAQGLIQAQVPEFGHETEPPAAPERNEDREHVAVTTAIKPVFLEEKDASFGGHLFVQTSVDRAAPEREVIGDKAGAAASCFEKSLLDVPSWGKAPSVGLELGRYRSEVFDTVGAVNSSAVTDLAKYELFLTFGAEAIALIERFPSDFSQPDLLIAIGQIMDNGRASLAPILVDQMSCDGETALWATLAQPALQEGQNINTDAVILAFGALPAHLRKHLGPELAAKFLAINDIETAARLKNGIERSLSEPTPEYQLLDAKMEIAAGHLSRASEKLGALVTDDTNVLPEALMTSVETTLAAGKSVAPDITALMESVAVENENGLNASRLNAAIVGALASDGDFDSAFRRAFDVGVHNAVPDEKEKVIRSDLFEKLAVNASDSDFIRLLVPRMNAAIDLRPKVRRLLAARLIDLGFAGKAKVLLDAAGANPDEDDRFLYAKAALQEGRPRVAISYLAGSKSREAEKIRAEALRQAGDFNKSVELFLKIGDRSSAMEAAWLGGDWTVLAANDDSAKGALAKLINKPSIANSAEGRIQNAMEAASPKPLQRASDLIHQSENLRSVIDELLGEIPIVSAGSG